MRYAYRRFIKSNYDQTGGPGDYSDIPTPHENEQEPHRAKTYLLLTRTVRVSRVLVTKMRESERAAATDIQDSVCEQSAQGAKSQPSFKQSVSTRLLYAIPRQRKSDVRIRDLEKGSKVWNVLCLVVERFQTTAANFSSLFALNHLHLLSPL